MDPNSSGEVVTLTSSVQDAVANPSIFSFTSSVLLSVGAGHPEFAYRRGFLAGLYWARFADSKKPSDVEGALMYQREAVGGTPVGHPDLPGRLLFLARIHAQRYEMRGDLRDLDHALKYQLAVPSVSPIDDAHLERHWDLGGLYSTRFRRLERPEDLDSAFKHHRAALELTPSGHRYSPGSHYNLGNCYRDCYKRFGRLADLESALAYHKAALDLCLEGNPRIPAYQHGLAVCLSDLYDRTANVDDLETMLKLIQAAASVTPRGHSNFASLQQSLGTAYNARYQRLGNLSDLESALQSHTLALSVTPMNHPGFPVLVEQLALAYRGRFRHNNAVADLKTALKCQNAALSTSPPDHPGLPERHYTLALIYYDLYEQSGSLEDLEAALSSSRSSVEKTTPEHPELPSYHQCLARTLCLSFQRLGKEDDLRSALQYALSALAATPPGHLSITSCQETVAAIHHQHYRRFGEYAHLEAALKYQNETVALTPPGHPRLTYRQNTLAIQYSDHYRRMGGALDLDHALRYAQAAVGSTPSGSDLVSYQQSLAEVYSLRFHEFRDLADLDLTIKYNTLVVAGTPLGHLRLARRLQSLGIDYSERFQMLGKDDDIQNALKYKQAALDELPVGHPDLADCQQSLALSFIDYFKKTNNTDDLGSAIEYLEAAIAGAPDDHPAQIGYQVNLGLAYSYRFQKSNDTKDLEAATSFQHMSLHKVPDGHPDQAGALKNLFLSYQEAFRRSNEAEDLYCALYYAQAATQSITAPPHILWNAAGAWAYLAGANNLPEAQTAFLAAMRVLPSLLMNKSTLPDLHKALLQFDIPSLVLQGVSTCIQFDNLPLAVEMFEQGLTFTYQDLLKLRSPVTELAKYHPNLAQDYTDLAFQTQANFTQMGGDNESLSLAIKRNNLVGLIRKQKGFESFLSSKPYSELSRAAEDGPVVIICSTGMRTDAIIIVAPHESPLLVGLNASEEEVFTVQKRFKKALGSFHIASRDPEAQRLGRPFLKRREEQDSFENIMAWLQKVVVLPVMRALRNHGIHTGRLWWCPTGPFTYLPLHAATPKNTFIPSYTSTLDGLIRARRKKHLESREIRVTAIAVPSIPGKPHLHLPSVVQEVQNIQEAVGDDRIIPVVGDEATSDHVASLLPASTWLHLACHGQQNKDQAFKSSLLLYEGELELVKVLGINIPAAEFVFLSACQTAMGDAKLVNESMHLAGGLIFAGFRGAVGTLWSMFDSDGPRVASMVYTRLFRDGRTPDASEVAKALHDAIQALRDEGAPFHRWAPFIHIGI